MSTPDGRFTLVFNGEIYNYVELRQSLEAKGEVFASRSDTEVLLRLFVREGQACLSHLRGMFAFAVWDRDNRRLFLARDRAGEKPLVYAECLGHFVFASEIRALLALPWMPHTIDPLGIHHGLHYVTVPPPYSAFKAISKLRPGECMTVSPSGVRSEIYWQPRYDPAAMMRDQHECEEAVRNCLDDTVRMMNRSDVPLGSVLSGGIDSSSVVASLAATRPSPDTFCVSYRGEQSSESEFPAARLVAERYATRHHEITFGANNLAALPDVVRHYAEPFASFVPLHAQALAVETKRHVTVVLTGSGGDELFGNYDEHMKFHRIDRRRQGNRWLGALSALVRGRSGDGNRDARREWIKSERDAWWAAGLRLDGMKAFWGECYGDVLRRAAMEHDAARMYVEAFGRYGAPTLFDNFVYQQIVLGSLHSLVDIPDISGMAHALEYRAPFLDVNMMELALKIPSAFKVNTRRGAAGGKWVVRMSQKDRLPHRIVHKPKSGFGEPIPYRRWMIGEWESDMRRLLGSGRLEEAGLFRTERLLQSLDEAKRGVNVPMDLLWGAAVVSQWLDEYC